MRKILTVTAHPDDEVLGFASNYTLAGKGYKIFNCILSGQVEARKDRPELNILSKNILKAQKLLGQVKQLLGASLTLSLILSHILN